MPRRYVFLSVAAVLHIAVVFVPIQTPAATAAVYAGVIVLVIAYFSAVRDIFANPRLELVGKLRW